MPFCFRISVYYYSTTLLLLNNAKGKNKREKNIKGKDKNAEFELSMVYSWIWHVLWLRLVPLYTPHSRESLKIKINGGHLTWPLDWIVNMLSVICDCNFKEKTFGVSWPFTNIYSNPSFWDTFQFQSNDSTGITLHNLIRT